MAAKPIKKILIANRGEISRRIQKACRNLNIDCVVVASDIDSKALFAREADRLALLGASAPSDSYLNIDKLLSVAKEYGCDAVHPGYGFLSENAEFARRVEKENLIFIGPSSTAIEILGSKSRARQQVAKYGVPLVPGTAGGLSDKELLEEAKKIGCPVLIKAVAGGGGRGMRVVTDEKKLAEEISTARSEARKYFSNDDVFIEKYISLPRHVEVQVFGDLKGNLVHFGTRDCSTQRRHQKLIEEAPAPNLSKSLRSRIHDAALKAAQSVGYYNAGTVEFLVSGEEFYFLEMNTRIQVEHPVTEMVCNKDLVELQIKVAQGETLPSQIEINFVGHAIEFRINAEDPESSFRPVTGVLHQQVYPELNSVRVDNGFSAGDEVSPFYDGLLSKIIIRAASRSKALELSWQALQMVDFGDFKTTLPFHQWMLINNDFRRSPVDVGFVERVFDGKKDLRAVLASLEFDPSFKHPVSGAEHVEFSHYRSKKFEHDYQIELVHRRGHFFEARPVERESRKLPSNEFRRISNGAKAALESLVSDVLEVFPPNRIFTSTGTDS